MRFAITIDTEVDKDINWHVSQPVTYTGVYQGVVDILQPLFERYGVPPVYFLSNEILASTELSSVFAPYDMSGVAELATHLHYEAGGPLALRDIAGKNLDGIQAQLSHDQEYEALRWLTEIFETRFGHRPASFRAGRYGLGPNSIRILADLGYLVDSSATPGLCWDYEISGQKYRCDYRQAPKHPYECASNDAGRPGSSGVIQIPISLNKASLTLRELARLTIRRPRRYIWARPKFATQAEMTQMVQAAAKRNDPSEIMVVMFHNMEVMPGKSPYCRSQEDSRRYLTDLEHFITTALRHGLRPTTLEGYVRATQRRACSALAGAILDADRGSKFNAD
jgi:hypothetical protein